MLIYIIMLKILLMQKCKKKKETYNTFNACFESGESTVLQEKNSGVFERSL